MGRRANIVTLDFLLHRARYDEETGCINWQMSTNAYGYGMTSSGGTQLFAHRKMYELYYSVELLSSDIVRHECDNPACINPTHLLLGTQIDNVSDTIVRDRYSKKLTRDQVVAIRAKYNSGAGITQDQLAIEFGLCQGTISAIVREVIWQHIANTK